MKLLIDGVDHDPTVASTMHQDIPYPGGHRYKLSITVPIELFDFLKPGIYEPPSPDIEQRALSRLTRLLRGNATRQCDFFLNNIERLAVAPDYSLEILGVCSPYVEHGRSTAGRPTE